MSILPLTLSKVFRNKGRLLFSEFNEICPHVNLPVYTKRAIYEAVCKCAGLQASDNPNISLIQFNKYWHLLNKHHPDSNDEVSRLIFTLAIANDGLPVRTYLKKDDFRSIIQDMIETYPGLQHLRAAQMFHARYIDVVIARLLWKVNRYWSGRMYASDIRKSCLLENLKKLETTQNINDFKDYFIYEHFYVIYCKFWELDTDHDMLLSKYDLKFFYDGAIPGVVINRIFEQAALRKSLTTGKPLQKIDYLDFEEFTYFLLAEEDKRHPSALTYWFRCLDVDDDGIISLYEMEMFYKGIVKKAKHYETLEFRDIANMLYDLVSPENGQITMIALKRCGLAHRFFNTFINWVKYLEQDVDKGERGNIRPNGVAEKSDWEKFCEAEYHFLMVDVDHDGSLTGC